MIIGVGEDGPDGLSPASMGELQRAEIVIGAPRHLALLPDLKGETREWPVPFADGIAQLMSLRGRKVVVLASGDPFWLGAGTVLAGHLEPGEWTALPAPSTFSLMAAHLGWGLEKVTCLGLHAAPLARLRPHLAPGARLMVLLRDGPAVGELAAYLKSTGFGATKLHVMQAMGGPRQRVTVTSADDYDLSDVSHPVAVALEVAGEGKVVTRASGRADDLFDHDGQITKRPMRALALSALAPRGGELLWDIGAGSGSIAIEWLLSHPANTAIAFEANHERADRALANARALGVDHIEIVKGTAPDALADQQLPNAVFIGGGLSEELLSALFARLHPGTRLVAHAVTLESEALLANWHAQRGGSLMRVELAEASALGSRRGWKSAYPIVQWSVST